MFEFMSTKREKNNFSVATEFYFLKREFAVNFNIRLLGY